MASGGSLHYRDGLDVGSCSRSASWRDVERTTSDERRVRGRQFPGVGHTGADAASCGSPQAQTVDGGGGTTRGPSGRLKGGGWLTSRVVPLRARGGPAGLTFQGPAPVVRKW